MNANRGCARHSGSFITRPRYRRLFKAPLVFSLSAACLTAVPGCASVTVKKVPTPTQYIRWSDNMQRRSDKMEGIRYYLPRPFVSVFESFPVRTDIFIVDGVVSPDGKYVIVERVRPDSGMAQYMASSLTGVPIPNRLIRDPSGARLKAAEIQAGEEAAAGAALAEAAGDIVPTGVEGQPEEPPSQPTKTEVTGRNVRSATNDNSAFAFQPLRGNFDIVYLPDFEEQYVVSSKSGLGNAEFAVNLGQGWSLQGFNSTADTSALTSRIFDLVDTAMKLAKDAATQGLNLLRADGAPGTSKLIEPQAGEEVRDGGTPGTSVTVKVVVVHYAAKGLYPVIKPRELQERQISIERNSFFIDLLKLFPGPFGVSEVDPEAIHNAQREIERETGHFTVPRYPYQYVSFNTFRYMALEVLKLDNLPFGTLYDRTGVVGDRGDAQAADYADALTEIANRIATSYDPKSTSGRSGDSAATLNDQWADALKGRSRMLNGVTITITASEYANGNLKVSLSPSGTPAATCTIDMVLKEVAEMVMEVAGDLGLSPIPKERIVIQNWSQVEPKFRTP